MAYGIPRSQVAAFPFVKNYIIVRRVRSDPRCLVLCRGRALALESTILVFSLFSVFSLLSSSFRVLRCVISPSEVFDTARPNMTLTCGAAAPLCTSCRPVGALVTSGRPEGPANSVPP